MRLRVMGCVAAVVGALLMSFGPVLVAQTLTVDEIVAKNLAAKGGVEKLRAIESVKMVGRIKGPSGETPVTSWAKRPNLRRRESTNDGQIFTLGFDGTTVWAINPLMSPRPQEITGPQAEMTRQDAGDFDSILLDYKAKGHTVELVAAAPAEGSSMYHLRVHKKGGPIQDIYLNAETMLESRMVTQLEQGGRKGVASLEFSNYKPVDGITVPFHIRQSFNGQMMVEVTYDQVQFNVEMPASLFTMPVK